MFFIIALLCLRRAACADDADTFHHRLRETNQQEVFRIGVPDNDLTDLVPGVFLVGEIRASGSLNTEAASVNCTRCFLKFDLAFRLSHSNTGDIGAIYRIPEM